MCLSGRQEHCTLWYLCYELSLFKYVWVSREQETQVMFISSWLPTYASWQMKKKEEAVWKQLFRRFIVNWRPANLRTPAWKCCLHAQTAFVRFSQLGVDVVWGAEQAAERGNKCAFLNQGETKWELQSLGGCSECVPLSKWVIKHISRSGMTGTQYVSVWLGEEEREGGTGDFPSYPLGGN